MKRFIFTLVIAIVVFFGFMYLASMAAASPGKSPFRKSGPVVQFDAPSEYTGLYTLKGEFGPNDVLADGTQIRAQTCYDPGLPHKSSFTLENVNGVATINEVELARDNLFSFVRQHDGIKIGHTLITRGRMLTLRFLEIKRRGKKITAEGYMLKVDSKSGEIYCGNSLKMRGTIRKY